MLVVEPSSSCDVCLEPYEWDDIQRTPHIIDCGHVFCAQCLDRVSPTRCPVCRKLFLPSEVRKLYVECSTQVAQKEENKEEANLLNELIMVYDGTEEEILILRNRVDEWLGNQVLEEESPLRKARDALELYQQLKLKRNHDRKKIKSLERDIRHSQESAARKQAEVSIMEQSLRSQLAQQQAQIEQLRTEIDKKQILLDQRKVKKPAISKPLPLPKVPITISNPLPSPPRLVQVTANKPTHRGFSGDHGARGNLHHRLPIYEKEDTLDSPEDNAAYFTCLTAPPVWLHDDISEEPLLQRPFGDVYH
ncbi:hypothetical protein GYMLUDRAFT_98670 [Collybiopsis luxurians FD-317 M1]|uniref:RING-type domain-containing protein n=1 Tax=Collybiopsis luxurians FD-317 M1 TaxID=944289 RepID=A0A0D0B2D6_9AGAR|nr:hypothetical protein GYMLUDRAFT_98670 [Collybiopsis luxurians FD-317 M1]